MIIDFSKYKVRITDKSVNEAFAEKVKIHKIIEYVQDKINTVFKKALCECLHHFPKILFLEKKAPDFLRG